MTDSRPTLEEIRKLAVAYGSAEHSCGYAGCGAPEYALVFPGGHVSVEYQDKRTILLVHGDRRSSSSAMGEPLRVELAFSPTG